MIRSEDTDLSEEELQFFSRKNKQTENELLRSESLSNFFETNLTINANDNIEEMLVHIDQEPPAKDDINQEPLPTTDHLDSQLLSNEQIGTTELIKKTI